MRYRGVMSTGQWVRWMSGVLALFSMSAAQAENEPHPYVMLLPGNYAVIGQEPDNGIAYAGTAEIRSTGGKLELIKTIGEQSVHATIEIEHASPGEAEVLRISWPEYQETCLVSADLDNYARLTCYWTRSGQLLVSPGMEAYFSKGGWPKNSESLNTAHR